MADLVTCAACGARIRADRPRCLRCDEPLVPSEGGVEPSVPVVPVLELSPIGGSLGGHSGFVEPAGQSYVVEGSSGSVSLELV